MSTDWSAVGFAIGVFMVALLSKAAFWICVCLFWAAGIVTSAIEKASNKMSASMDEALEELRTTRSILDEIGSRPTAERITE